MCLTKVVCLTVSLHSTENCVFVLLGPLYLENSKRYTKSAVTILKPLIERIPMKKSHQNWMNETEGLRKRSMIRPQHVYNRRINMNLVLA